jgi:HlyD family secretion protein
MNKGWIIGIVALVLFCALGGYAVNAGRRMFDAKKDKAPQPKVEKGDVTVRVVESGSLVAYKSVEVKSRVSGRVAKLVVDEGEYVEQGQLIAIIDPQETELQVEQNAAQVRGAQAGMRRTSIEVGQRRVTAQAALDRARANLRQVELELRAQPQLTNASIIAAKSALDQARQAKDQLLRVTHPNSRVAAETALEDAVAARQRAEAELRRQESLLAKGYVSRREAESASLNLQTAVSREATAREAMETIAEAQRIEARQAEERIRQAEAELDRARAGSVQDGVKREQLRQAQAAVREATAQLRDVEALRASQAQQAATVEQLSTVLRDGRRQLAETRIVAPISGVVTRRFVQIGELVASLNSFSAGSPIFRIEDRSKMLIQLQVNEIDVARLRLAMPAEIVVDAFPGRMLEGKVSKVAPTSVSQGQPQDAAGGAEAVVKYGVEVTLLRPEPDLKSGMSAKCTMRVLDRQNVVRVPLGFLGEKDGETFLMIRKPGSKPDDKGTKTIVKVGARSATHAEIVSGAKVGDLLVKPGFTGPKRKGMMEFGVASEEEGQE